MIAVALFAVALTAAPVRWAPAPLSSDGYESSATFTPDGREIYFMRSDRSFRQWKILAARCERGAWSTPHSPSFAATPPGLDADPFVSADGKRLYFVSTRQNADGGDQLDIWLTRRDANGAWGEPQRLPEPVNSTASELLPRETADGRLVFGSDRAGGFGQGDIYIATPRADGWTVANAGAPVSSAANEYEAEVSQDGKTLVVVADRGTRSHLYRYRREGERWIGQGQVPADDAVFQVGPLLSPRGDRVLFAQADGARSGEFFLVDLAENANASWPPICGK
ncbi:TolB family protein [Tahibacter soli]|uniref:WD40 repeat protein n=1 Tax=Tahibacter soli TaxID=2983605 RepID=A0A9X3YLS1_9GAMM|nr:hypothetical protein [Tahibacter soli]MDC8013982.1 hypothetical protein [Tahibacter soli]